MKILSLSGLAGVLAMPAAGCDLCAVYSAAEASGTAGPGFYSGIAEQFTRFGTLQDNGHKVPSEGGYINSSVSQLYAGYNINNKVGLQLNVPLIYRSFGSPTVHASEAGIGDFTLLGNFRAYQMLQEDFTFTWSLLGGVKFPTGNSNRLGDPDFTDGIGGHDLALGSGSVDGLVGTGIFSRWKRLFLTASVQYAIRSEGDFGHQYADDLIWSGGAGVYLEMGHKYTLALQAVVSGEYKGKDTFNGVPDGDSAETLVYLGPQINFTWREKLSVQVGADLPVSIYNSGRQVVPDYRVRAVVNWRF